jgi:hypothetical protein
MPRLPHGVPERVDCRFGLPHRYIHSVTQLMALLHQASHRLARRPDPAMYCYWKHRAAVEMRPDTVGQVRVAPRAPVCTDAERINRGHLSQVESSSAANALGDLVVPTVDEEECAFLGAQSTRPTTIEMTDNPEAEDDGVLGRDRSRALRARRGLLYRHWSIPNAKADGWTCRQGARRQLASPRMLQWSASGKVAPEFSLFNAFLPAPSAASRAMACAPISKADRRHQESHLRSPSSVVARFMLTRSCAPQLRTW